MPASLLGVTVLTALSWQETKIGGDDDMPFDFEEI